jgi:hypothetical protein
MRRLSALFAGITMVSSLFAPAVAGADEVELLGVVGLDIPEDSAVVAPLSEKPRGIYFMIPRSDKSMRLGPGPVHRVIYMNRNGGTYSPGNDNSTLNTSIVPSQTSQVAAWSYGDAAWNQLMTCVRLQYARFDVEVTDVDPGNTPHIESVTGGTPGQVQLPNGIGGVAPFTNDCSVVEQGVTFTFAAVYQGDLQAICETVAQETAHALGFDHEFLCADPMTSLGGCGAKAFPDTKASCGEDSARACACGGTQNSVQGLLQVLGPADNQAPSLDILEPQDGATVLPPFAISANASDAGGVSKVDLYIDGGLVESDSTAPFAFVAPAGLATGGHTIELRATDGSGQTTARSISVNLATPGGGDTDPPGGDTTPPPGGDTGGGDDEIGAPPTVFGGCSAAADGRTASGATALLLLAAALLLAARRRS